LPHSDVQPTPAIVRTIKPSLSPRWNKKDMKKIIAVIAVVVGCTEILGSVFLQESLRLRDAISNGDKGQE
jgi:hypothetical protein